VQRKDHVETGGIEIVRRLARRPAADTGAGNAGDGKAEAARVLRLGMRRKVAECRPRLRQTIEESPGCAAAIRTDLKHAQWPVRRPSRSKLGERPADQIDAASTDR
jgi:hypothetical protein